MSVFPLSNLASGRLSLSAALEKVDNFNELKPHKLTLSELGRILWAAQGVTKRDSGWIYPLRAAPSAGGLYPLEVYVIVASDGVEELEEGLYHYDPVGEVLTLVEKGSYHTEITRLLKIGVKGDVSMVYILICAVYHRTTEKYGYRGIMYVHNEVGHVVLNAMVECASLNLACEILLIRSDADVKKLLNIMGEPLLLMKIGKTTQK
ncbi:MAG: SagB/ThcOx family dehydrogenase [Nitrososphaerales archaeon]